MSTINGRRATWKKKTFTRNDGIDGLFPSGSYNVENQEIAPASIHNFIDCLRDLYRKYLLEIFKEIILQMILLY